MLRIWGRRNSSNVAKVMWTVAELDLPHERVDIGGPFGGLDTPDYRRLNPNGQIPTIEDEGLVLWESNAIVRYLAAAYGAEKLWPGDVRAQADADRWMDWSSSVVAPAIDDLRRAYRGREPAQRDPEAISRTLAKAASAWGIVEPVLAVRPFLAGDALTVADIALGPLLHRWHLVPLDRPDLPAVTAWYRRLLERPAFAEHVAAVVQ